MMSMGLTLETASVARREAGLVGPNAVLQLAAALRAATPGDGMTERIFTSAGFEFLLENSPRDMIDEAIASRLFDALWRELPGEQAACVAYDAGRRTADYILANRIPKVAQAILKALPARIAAQLLLKAIAKNAWTFAGSGHCEVFAGRVSTVRISMNPLAMPGCVWHVGVFERLFQALVDRRTHVRQTQCCAAGGQACSFDISFGPEILSAETRTKPGPIEPAPQSESRKFL